MTGTPQPAHFHRRMQNGCVSTYKQNKLITTLHGHCMVSCCEFGNWDLTTGQMQSDCQTTKFRRAVRSILWWRPHNIMQPKSSQNLFVYLDCQGVMTPSSGPPIITSFSSLTKFDLYEEFVGVFRTGRKTLCFSYRSKWCGSIYREISVANHIHPSLFVFQS